MKPKTTKIRFRTDTNLMGWSSLRRRLISKWKKMEKIFWEVTLACEDEQLATHKLIIPALGNTKALRWKEVLSSIRIKQCEKDFCDVTSACEDIQL